MVKFLEPEYYGRFACLAGDCKYTCCRGWTILIRRPEYHKLRGLRVSPELKRAMDASMKRIKKDASDSKYAVMQLDEENRCLFLGETGLCRLQVECGAGALPAICKSFPRLLAEVPGGYQRCCTTGCEQTVHLLLQAKDGLRFLEREQVLEAGQSITTKLAPEMKDTPQSKYFAQIQALCIAILQNRAYTLEERMILLGLALQDFDAATGAGDDAVQDWLRRRRAFATPEGAEAMRESLAALPKNQNLGVMNSLLLADAIQMHAKDTVYNTLVEKAFAAIEAHVDLMEESSERLVGYSNDKYAAALQGYAEQTCGLEYLLENVLVNFFFEQLAPLAGPSMWEFYLGFCSMYSFFRVLSVAYLAACPGQEAYIHVLTVCSRRLFHSPATVQQIVERLHKTSADTMAHMAMLVKG